MSSVCRRAIAEGHRSDDPTANVTSVLPRHKGEEKHHEAAGLVVLLPSCDDALPWWPLWKGKCLLSALRRRHVSGLRA